MALRTVALCDGQQIGIESIYTVVNGVQINIPEKLNALRLKSRNNELFCPCGCGANLILVAGDRNLREQHFRVKNGKDLPACTYVSEGLLSVASKIVLKCWLDDYLRADDIRSRVRVCDISDSPKKFEFSFLSLSLGIAVDYCYNRANLSDEKQTALEETGRDLTIIHIVDHANGGTNGQYPEWMMKIQKRQGYCLLLSVADMEYKNAAMKAVFYAQNADNLWKEITVTEGLLKNYKMDAHGQLFFEGTSLRSLVESKQKACADEIAAEKERRVFLRKQAEEQEKQRQAELERQRAEAEEEKKRHDEAVALAAEEYRIAEEKRKAEEQRQDQEFIDSFPELLAQSSKPIYYRNRRWIMCKFCKNPYEASECKIVGMDGNCNIGVCRSCSENMEVREKLYDTPLPKKNNYEPICPSCGGKLIKRFGPFGTFWSCSNYPICKFRRSINGL